MKMLYEHSDWGTVVAVADDVVVKIEVVVELDVVVVAEVE
jgi:hypothetical protein